MIRITRALRLDRSALTLIAVGALCAVLPMTARAQLGGMGTAVSDPMNLTDDQKRKIQTIQDKYKPQFDAVKLKYKPQSDIIRAKYKAQMDAVKTQKLKPEDYMRRMGEIDTARRKAGEPISRKVVAESKPIQDRMNAEIQAILTPQQREIARRINTAAPPPASHTFGGAGIKPTKKR